MPDRINNDVEDYASKQSLEKPSTDHDIAIETGGIDGARCTETAERLHSVEKHDGLLAAHDLSATAAKDRKQSRFRQCLPLVAEQWFLLTLGILIAIASQVQVSMAHQEQKRTLTSYICISIIFFITGSTLDTKILLQNYARWKIHLYTQALCFLITSAIVFGLVSLVTINHTFLDPGLLVGLIFFSCVATTISSNVVMTRQAHGNTALTVVQTTIGNLIGVFITPALLVMYTSVDTWYNAVLPPAGNDWSEIYRRVLKQIGLSIYLPLVVGQVTRYFFSETCKKVFVDWKLNKLGSICLLTLLWATYDQAFATSSFSRVPGSNMVFIVFISSALWLVFLGITFLSSIWWVEREDVVALCMCVPAKSIIMAVPISSTVWAGIDLEMQSKILIPIVIFQGLQLAFASVLVPVFRRWVDRKKRQDQEAAGAAEGSIGDG
ncbi:hypothetical protein LTR09_007502 [Extremus antarcticus]|uniref:Sodium bile acid symporter family protein n=1 Tax=Extremus antarcticus TaxID=702011 RepID=A0AAJ0DCL2_9PEZI|nr:hypothetical protein LTR09_007502 [Extremus antarcticus]